MAKIDYERLANFLLDREVDSYGSKNTAVMLLDMGYSITNLVELGFDDDFIDEIRKDNAIESHTKRITFNGYDWGKIAGLIRERTQDTIKIMVGIKEDWEWTSITVWKDKYTEAYFDMMQKKEILGIQGSSWGTPVLRLYDEIGPIHSTYIEVPVYKEQIISIQERRRTIYEKL